MKHNRRISKTLPCKATLYWCDGRYDGFCFHFACQDGFWGIAGSGGIVTMHVFYPLFPCLKPTG